MTVLSESSLDTFTVEQHTTDELFAIDRHPGDTVFAFASVCVGLLMLFQIEEQTKWVNNAALLMQPRFWPGMCLVGFLFFATGYLIISFRQHLKTDGDVLVPGKELLHWCHPIEYAIYFTIYVALVPQLGYLPATLLVFPALTFRVGYRNFKYMLLSLAVGIATVVVFKTLLQVRIPGGQLYEIFPEQIRNFMILHL